MRLVPRPSENQCNWRIGLQRRVLQRGLPRLEPRLHLVSFGEIHSTQEAQHWPHEHQLLRLFVGPVPEPGGAERLQGLSFGQISRPGDPDQLQGLSFRQVSRSRNAERLQGLSSGQISTPEDPDRLHGLPGRPVLWGWDILVHGMRARAIPGGERKRKM